jgi:3-dehydroquinate synthase
MIAAPHQRVAIALGERSYDIVIGRGLIDQASTWSGLPKAATALIVTNTRVGPLYAERGAQGLAGPEPDLRPTARSRR